MTEAQCIISAAIPATIDAFSPSCRTFLLFKLSLRATCNLRMGRGAMVWKDYNCQKRKERYSEEEGFSEVDQNTDEIRQLGPCLDQLTRSQSWSVEDNGRLRNEMDAAICNSALIMPAVKDVFSANRASLTSDNDALLSKSTSFDDQVSMSAVEEIAEEPQQQKRSPGREDRLISAPSRNSDEIEDTALRGGDVIQSHRNCACSIYNGDDDGDDKHGIVDRPAANSFRRKRRRRKRETQDGDDDVDRRADDEPIVLHESSDESNAVESDSHDHQKPHKGPTYSEERALEDVSVSDTPIGEPSIQEIEHFLAEAEQSELASQMIRYNFDFQKDAPMQGRFEWIAIAEY